MKSSALRTTTTKKPASFRSAVTNGKRLHVVAPGDHAWARRFRDVLGEIVSDLGGPDRLSEGQRQLARRCAMLSVECEKLESLGVAGGTIDLEAYNALTNTLGRAFQRLGLKRVPKDVPTLHEHLARLASERPPLPIDDTDEAALPAETVDEGAA